MKHQLDEVRNEQRAKFQAAKQKDSQSLKRVNDFIFGLNDYLEQINQFKRDFYTLFSADKLTESGENIYKLRVDQLEFELNHLITEMGSLPITAYTDFAQDKQDCLTILESIRNGIYDDTYSHITSTYEQLEKLSEKFMTIKNHLESLCYEFQHKHIAQQVSLSTLPAELFQLILDYLDPKDVLAVTQTCKRAEELSNDSLLWKKRLLQHGVFSPDEIKNLTNGFKKVYRRYSKDIDVAFFKNQLTGVNKQYQECINKKKELEPEEKNLNKQISDTRNSFDVANFKKAVGDELKNYISYYSSIWSHSEDQTMALSYSRIMSDLEGITDFDTANALIKSLKGEVEYLIEYWTCSMAPLKACFTKSLAIANEKVAVTNKLLADLNRMRRRLLCRVGTEFRKIGKEYDQLIEEDREVFKEIIDTHYKEFINKNTNIYQLCTAFRENLNQQTQCIKKIQSLTNIMKLYEPSYYDTTSAKERLNELNKEVQDNQYTLKNARQKENQLIQKADELGITHKLAALSEEIRLMTNAYISEDKKIQIMRKVSPKDYDQTMQELYKVFPEEFLNYFRSENAEQIEKEYNQILKM